MRWLGWLPGAGARWRQWSAYCAVAHCYVPLLCRGALGENRPKCSWLSRVVNTSRWWAYCLLWCRRSSVPAYVTPVTYDTRNS